jgi:hypothetical protein
MKILWLTPGQLSAALLFGIMIAICNISIPHMVDEVKPQVITPIPTPPPVIITQVPVDTSISSNMTDGVAKIILEYNQMLLSPIYLIFMIIVLAITMISSSRSVIFIVFSAVGFAYLIGWIGFIGFITMMGVCFMSMLIPSMFRMGSDNI